MFARFHPALFFPSRAISLTSQRNELIQSRSKRKSSKLKLRKITSSHFIPLLKMKNKSSLQVLESAKMIVNLSIIKQNLMYMSLYPQFFLDVQCDKNFSPLDTNHIIEVKNKFKAKSRLKSQPSVNGEPSIYLLQFFCYTNYRWR